MAAPLKGITVVEMSTFVAGPVTGRLLADLGATVIKVEKTDGDNWRETGKSYLPLIYSDEQNPVFDIYNSGKRHVALNVKSPEGKEALMKLLENAQVFVTNTRPAALKRLGLDPETLRAKFPGLVYALLLGYGENGPDADLPAFDTTAFWSRSGFLADLSIKKDGYMPVQPPYSMGDTVTGYMLTLEICAALLRREKTGEGDLVKASLFHNSIFTMGTMQIISQPPYGRVFPEDRPGWGSYGGSFCCKDGVWVYLSDYSVTLLEKLYAMLGVEHLHSDPRFAGVMDRWDNRYAHYEIIRDAFLKETSAHWLAEAKKLDMPLMRVGHYSDLVNDEQAWANGYLERVTFKNGKQKVMPSTPIEMDSVGTVPTKPAPEIGADTREVLKSLGYTAEEIEKMKELGAVRTASGQ